MCYLLVSVYRIIFCYLKSDYSTVKWLWTLLIDWKENVVTSLIDSGKFLQLLLLFVLLDVLVENSCCKALQVTASRLSSKLQSTLLSMYLSIPKLTNFGMPILGHYIFPTIITSILRSALLPQITPVVHI